MNPFLKLWEAISGNSKSVRLVLTLASLVFLTSVFSGTLSSPASIWTVNGEHWALEQYIVDLAVAFVICLIVQSLCWMDTIRPLDKGDLIKQIQIAKLDPSDLKSPLTSRRFPPA